MFRKCLSVLLVIIIFFSLLTICATGAYAEETVVSVIGAVIGDDYPGADTWNFYTGECTSFVAWRMESQNHIQKFKNGELIINDTEYNVINTIDIDDYGNFGGTVLGHAKYWGTAFQSMGFPVDSCPKVGSIAWTTNGTYGHVAWVASIEEVDITTEDDVIKEEYVTVEEYNAGGGYHRYGTRRRTKQEWIDDGYQFIHVKDILNIPDNAVRSGIFGLNSGWYLSEDGVLTILGIGDMNDYPRYGLYAPWDGSDKVKSVVIDEGITSIGAYSFYLCKKLNSISIPDTVTRIGSHAFDQCENLTDITIPDSVIQIDSYAFFRCYFIKNLVIPDSVTEIGEGAFASCHYLESIILPNSITSLSARLLCDNYSMKSITIPDSVTSIGEEAFCIDYELLSITIPDSVTSIGDGAFSQCISITNVIIPESVKHIGNGAFDFCKSLTHIRLPSKITDIGDGAFCECYELKSIAIPSSVTSIGERAFLYCDKLENVYFGGSRGEWKNVTIKDENDCLLKANMSFGCKWNQYSQLFAVDENNTPVFEILPNGKKVDPIFLDEILLDLILNENFLLTAQSTDEYRWYSTDENVVIVENGNITAVSSGEAYVIAETNNGARAICKVVVKTPPNLGDVDGDGEVTIIDATCIQRHLASIPTASCNEKAADADGDGSVTILDATEIQRHLAQLQTNENIGKPIA